MGEKGTWRFFKEAFTENKEGLRALSLMPFSLTSKPQKKLVYGIESTAESEAEENRRGQVGFSW